MINRDILSIQKINVNTILTLSRFPVRHRNHDSVVLVKHLDKKSTNVVW
jgi:hypothetical protein